MTRSIGHLLLILVVLACPVQCVIGADSCCDSGATSEHTTSGVLEQSCSSKDACCRHSGVADDAQDASNEQPKHVPSSDDDCRCDCLCKGAISTSVQIVEDLRAVTLPAVTACDMVLSHVFGNTNSLLADPPDAHSGREIRTLRMSFQV
jgi:hypothetical protein